MSDIHSSALPADSDIAIVGMAAHLPAARSLEQYWHNLRGGVESIRRLSPEELQAAGEPAHLLNHPDYVPHAAPLEGFDQFDAEFFGFSPREAAIMDPQHRQFLEVCWEALEDAGHPPGNFKRPIGVFAGSGMGSYFYFNICSNPDLVRDVGMFLLRHTGNDKDFLSTRVSHIFDLKGPSVNIQTACSTSLVAVHSAVQSLRSGECDMALAGGVTVDLPQGRGYLYKEGEVLSPDGHCHAFDHRARGTVFGSGAGVVALRRLEEAIADGDHIWAVIRGTAINNDGAAKAGYLAPSVDGQAAAIAEAQAKAGLRADTVDYVECHGTGTALGDPIEVAALTAAFRQSTDEVGYCRIGSVKSNIGHLDTAAGIAGLIKTALALHHRQIPPTLGYEKPNPAIDFATSPFRVNDRLADWPRRKGPRRAGVNALGVGGTNAHVILEEAPEREASEPADWPFHLLTISGRSKPALEANAAALAAHLRAHPEQPLADVAYTLKEGRCGFEHRRVVVAQNHQEAASLLSGNDPRRVFSHRTVGENPEVVFMFPGGGAQYAGMARDLYETEPVFAEWMARGLDHLRTRLDYDIRAIWLPEPGQAAASAEKLKQPSVQLPLLMIVEYALAQLWMSWGVRPAALVGHSMGENTAACLAGVMDFEDCIDLVLLRGQLFDTVAAGGMLSVALPAEELRPLLGEGLDLAAVNGPRLSVASGPAAALERLATELTAREVECRRVPINIAAHSGMLEPILKPFRDFLQKLTLRAPQIPIISNRDGEVLQDAEAMDPEYWVQHLRGTVHFSDCIATLAKEPQRIYLEVGLGKGLAALAGQHPGVSTNQVITTLRHPQDEVADDRYFMAMLGRMWAVGVAIDWEQIWGGARRNRVVLPSYAFQRARYFIAPGQGAEDATLPALPERRDDIAAWGYRPVWTARLAACEMEPDARESWLLFQDDTGLGAHMAERLRAAGQQVTVVRAGDAFARLGPDQYVLAPERGLEGYERLIGDLAEQGRMPTRVAHFWQVTRGEVFRLGSSFFHRTQEQGFYSLLFLAQALGGAAAEGIHLITFTNGAAQLRDEGLPYPEKATLQGPARMMARELPGMSCRMVDLVLPEGPKRRFGARPGGDALARFGDRVMEDLLAPPDNATAALRGERRYELSFKPFELGTAGAEALPLREDGTCLITGGFGGIGLTVAEALIARGQKRLVLVARRALPPRDEWAGPCESAAQQRAIRAVQHLESLGAEVLVIEGDVSNHEDMRRAVAAARERFGGLHGVIHAAGTINDAPMMSKSMSSVEEVFTAKVHGTRVLDEILGPDSLDWMVLFSSSSTVTAPAGQADYLAANAYLNAYAQARAGGRTRVLALNWGIWSEVGMAAEAMAARMGENTAPGQPVPQPMLGEAGFDAAGNCLFTARYDARAHWFLDEHRTRAGDALLPGTGYLELAAEALAAQGATGAFEIADLWFLHPLQVPDDAPQEVRILMPRREDGYDLEVCTTGAEGETRHAQARLNLTPLEAPAPLDLAALAARLERPEQAEPGEALRADQEGHLAFGPRWKVLQSTAYGQGEGLACLCLPPRFSCDAKAGYLLHPALMDLATGWAMRLIPGYDPARLWVPLTYRRVRVHAPLGQEIHSWARLGDGGKSEAVFDITLCAPDGRVLVEVEGFTLHRLEDTAAFARPAVPKQEAPRPLSVAEEQLRYNLSQGIRPSEGSEAFFRALGSGRPQVVVSALDLGALCRQAEAPEPRQNAGQRFERPTLESDYQPPEGAIEQRLAEIWQGLLGVDEIGADDSFFDLGGHSLIAVRLFAQIKKTWMVDLPISALFEAPSIRKIAALIHAQTDHAEPARGEAALPEQPQRRFDHLVAMHEGEGGSATPFFLVAGMFGNVLNLRHLAHLLGAGRRFYGLQARGLFGDREPHRDIEQAARDYIAEMRAVQPVGPYMIGGFSGGGITALEIARQLQESGEEVALLVMLDTPLPRRRPLSLRDRMVIQMQELRRGGAGYIGRWLLNRIRWELAKRRKDRGETVASHDFHNAAIEAAFLEAVGRYRPPRWEGPLVLFRPPLAGKWQVSSDRLVNSQRAYVTADNGWSPLAPRIEVIEVPGDHDSMVLEPHVRVLAARLKRCIEAAEKRQEKRLGAAHVPTRVAAE